MEASIVDRSPRVTPAAHPSAATLTGTAGRRAGLRVGVDGFNLAMPRGTGVATYARNLTGALAGLGHHVDVLYGMNISARTPDLLREVIFFDSLDQEKGRKPPVPFTPRWLEELARAPFGADAVRVPVTGRVVAQGFAARMPRYDRIVNVPDLFGMADRHFKRFDRFLRVRIPDPPAVMHWTYPLPILLEGARNVYTLHDLVPLRLPYTTLDNKRMYLRLIRGCLRWGDHVCTVSEASKRDIADLFGVPDDRMTNTYEASRLPEPPVPEGELDGWLQGLFGLQARGYFLYFGALEPKKNIGRIVEAYMASGVRTPLVVVGGRSWKGESELRLIAPGTASGLSAAGQVRQLEYMPLAWLTGLIRGARAVLFPSLYEGFGLPVLEAMQQGTPVLTGTESSLPEVAGAAAVLANPYSTAEIADGIRALDGDEALRARLSAEGPRQAERFSEERWRNRLSAMYDKVLAGPRGVPIALPKDGR